MPAQFENDEGVHPSSLHSDARWAVCFVAGFFLIFVDVWIIHLSFHNPVLNISAFVAQSFLLLISLNNVAKRKFDLRGRWKEGLTSEVWGQSREQQIKSGFKSEGYHLGLEVLSRSLPEEAVLSGSEYVIRSGSTTLAVANVLRIHDEACWTTAGYERLEHDGAIVSLSSIFESNSVRQRVRRAQIGDSDFVSLGLVSFDGEGAGELQADELSTRRAKGLGEALLAHSGVNPDQSAFSAVGLGCAIPHSEVGSPLNKKQRSAVVVAIIRRHFTSERLPFKNALDAIIQFAKVDEVRFSMFEHSADVQSRLKNSPIDFAGYTRRRTLVTQRL